ncbi:3-keto-5-aminohexanoate cleavage protein [Bosea sp. F3-2]|uniref:3-keto-5-aminohexanoate cleavage protein n=1 Tax=Bosea sp. F3-2 TaxID=2599640 RepID=UPI0011EF6824|nr:3-keto-5-aminohexanoate cleavage protein [Bosea sp. F3-2]QEL23511.1 3-keto-5-aminohexanoate cleavage protein [Bosea sp. F3-2]
MPRCGRSTTIDETQPPSHRLNVRLDRDRLAPSNAALVRRIVALCPEHGRHPAAVAEARALLPLPAAA